MGALQVEPLGHQIADELHLGMPEQVDRRGFDLGHRWFRRRTLPSVIGNDRCYWKGRRAVADLAPDCSPDKNCARLPTCCESRHLFYNILTRYAEHVNLSE